MVYWEAVRKLDNDMPKPKASKLPEDTRCRQFSTKRYGELEPLAYLHAWRDMGVPAHKTQCLCNPLVAEVDRQMDLNMVAFAELNARFHVSVDF